MPAYVVSRLKIINPEAMLDYQRRVVPVVHAFGGKYLMRGPEVAALEGTWEHHRMVILEFPTHEAALAWYHSPEYAPLKAQRHASGEAVILLTNSQSSGEIPTGENPIGEIPTGVGGDPDRD